MRHTVNSVKQCQITQLWRVAPTMVLSSTRSGIVLILSLTSWPSVGYLPLSVCFVLSASLGLIFMRLSCLLCLATRCLLVGREIELVHFNAHRRYVRSTAYDLSPFGLFTDPQAVLAVVGCEEMELGYVCPVPVEARPINFRSRNPPSTILGISHLASFFSTPSPPHSFDSLSTTTTYV